LGLKKLGKSVKKQSIMFLSIHDPGDQLPNLFERKRLLYKVNRAQFHRLESQFNRSRSSYRDDPDIGPNLANLAKDLHPIHSRHSDV